MPDESATPAPEWPRNRTLLSTALWFAVVAFANELLPVVFGTGEHARWDWAFSYVTLKFVALPAASVVLVIYSIYVLARYRGRVAAGALAAGTVAAAYLTVLYRWPLPWFA